MSTSKDRTLELLRAQVKERRENKLKSFEPYPRQREFIAATVDHSEVALRAGNQQGKSETAAYFVAASVTGRYPDDWKGRRWDRPIRAWACGESTVAVRDVNQRKLCGAPGDEAQLGTGFIPKDAILKTIIGHGAGGALDKVLVKHVSGGTSEITFKSYDQERSKWQGETLDLLWCDEEPPVEHYMEGLARLVATGGLAISTFTPLNGLNLILPRFSERSLEAVRDRKLIPMRLEDALHLQDPERRARLLATFPAHQRRARIDGLPLLGSGAEFTVPVENLIAPFRLHAGKVMHEVHGEYRTEGLPWLWGLDFGIGHAFGAVLLLWDRDTDIVYVMAELKIRDATPIVHASRMKAIHAGAKVAWPHDGNQRDKGSGEQLADIYKREGLNMLPTHATLTTGGYNFEASLAELKLRIEDGRLKISPACLELMEEYSNYHRKDGVIVRVNDDLISALRIGVMQLRSAKDIPLTTTRRDIRPSQPEIADGVNFDPWSGR